MKKPVITAAIMAVALLACAAADHKEKGKSPACMHCGSTCCLVPICVCEPGTKKKPRTEYETMSEPICVAGCGSKFWPFGRCHDRADCTSCTESPCQCPGWVRNRKTLKKETVDEEVPTIKRKVAYVCDACTDCGTGSCCDNRPLRSASSATVDHYGNSRSMASELSLRILQFLRL